ncbi:MAG: hypothetical protein HY804_11705 [Nitrospinae bacterium]|nr:hypothetical protein [Nitrospinota bacterium]
MTRRSPLDCIFYSLLVWAAAGGVLLALFQPPHGAAWWLALWIPLILMWAMIFIIPLVFITLLLWPKF